MLNAKRPSTNTEIRVWQPVHTCHTYHMVSCLITEGQAFKSGFLTVLWSPDSCPATSALQRLCKEYLPSSSGLQARHTSYLIPDSYPRTRENPERRPDSGSTALPTKPNHSVVFAPPSHNQQHKDSIPSSASPVINQLFTVGIRPIFNPEVIPRSLRTETRE